LAGALQEYTCLKGKGRSAVVFGIGSEVSDDDKLTWHYDNLTVVRALCWLCRQLPEMLFALCIIVD